MENNIPVSVQDIFFSHVSKNKTPLNVFLVNSIKLQGVVTWFDDFSIILNRDGRSQLVYKHSISTIMPQVLMPSFEGSKEHYND